MNGPLVADGRRDADALRGASGTGRGYDIHGIRLRVVADDATAIALVDDTYGAFAVPLDRGGAWSDFALVRGSIDPGWTVHLPDGGSSSWPDASSGLIALFDGLVGTVVARLHDAGIYAVHAAAVADPSGAIVVAGRSGQGKTTLALGLLSRGFGLLSDELALLDPTAGRVLAYSRSVHVRPGTLPLLPRLAVLEGRPRNELGGGSEWAIRPAEITRILGGRVALPRSAQVGAVVVLDGAPAAGASPRLTEISPAIAAMELLRGTWAASVDFGGTLAAVARAISTVPCARLAVGDLEATLDAVIEWRRRHDG